MSEARSYDVLDLSGEVRQEGVGMWLDGDEKGKLTVTEPDAPGEVPSEEPVVWITLERDDDDTTASMSGFVPLSEFLKLVEWAGRGFQNGY